MTSPYSWTATTITDLVYKPEYMGHTVNFRTFKESYNDLKIFILNTDQGAKVLDTLRYKTATIKFYADCKMTAKYSQ